MTNPLHETRTSIAVYILLILAAIVLVPGVGVVVALVIVSVLLAANRKQGIFRSIGFVRPESWTRALAAGLVFGLIIQLLAYLVFDPLFEKLTGDRIDLSSLDGVRGNFRGYVVLMLLGWGFGGFAEEIIFRGYLITRLKMLFGDSRRSLAVILLITSAPFGLAHMYQGLSGVLSTGLLAMFFGLMFIRSGYNLWYSIFTHGFVNTLGITLIYLDLDQSLTGPW
ncbi:MAG: CPBP family glutamic-type intramembrane protease [Gammaproteobacteria bacterium]|nr:CPBP family glutamic-type intramembrane protease [Gammaproteobacteria bacterium]